LMLGNADDDIFVGAENRADPLHQLKRCHSP
jgi:hypothetical protein